MSHGCVKKVFWSLSIVQCIIYNFSQKFWRTDYFFFLKEIYIMRCSSLFYYYFFFTVGITKAATFFGIMVQIEGQAA